MLTGSVRTAFAAILIVFVSASAIRAQQVDAIDQLFEERTHDFGVVARGAEVKYQLKLTNRSNTLIHISNVRTSCGCTSATAPKTSFAPGEVGYIDISLDTVRHKGAKESNVIVTFDAPYYREVYIPIRGYIRSDVVLTPGSADFGPVEQGKGSMQKIDINYAGRADWTIREVRTNNPDLDATVIEKMRNGSQVSYELDVALKPTAPVGNLNQQIILVTDDANSPFVPVLVHAKIEPDMTVTVTDNGSLGLVVPGQTKQFQVVIRATSSKPFAIEKIECESDLDAFAVRLPESAKPVHVLPITMTVPNRPGKFVEKFIVTVDGRPEPLTFTAYGEIAAAAR